jgi:class 3 adenylate cyclase
VPWYGVPGLSPARAIVLGFLATAAWVAAFRTGSGDWLGSSLEARAPFLLGRPLLLGFNHQTIFPELWIALACAGGAGLGYFAGLTGFLLGTAAAVATIAALGVGAALYLEWWLPWFPAACGFVACGSVLFFQKIRRQEGLTRTVRASLQGLVSPQRLRALTRKPRLLKLAPSTRVVTVVCIDVVGFSLSAERESAEVVFRFLKQLMETLTPILHRHGGTIGKSTSDGFLCVFGFPFTEGEVVSENHAEDAVRCAMEIQKQMADRNRLNFSAGTPVYPLRIGIHTDSVYIGDIGASDRIELAVLGNGVSFAQRLKAACEPYRVQIGPSTKDRVKLGPGEESLIQRKLVPVPPDQDLLEAYEVNPFHVNPGTLELCLTQYQQSAGLLRVETRWPVDELGWLVAKTKWGEGAVLNFSRGGIALRLGQYFGIGVKLSLQLDTKDGTLGEACRAAGLENLTGEIRWGKPMAGGFLHGVELKGLSPEQKETLFEAIRTRHFSAGRKTAS